MPVQTISASLVALPSLRVGVVVSRFNALITQSLLMAALDTLCRHGVPEENTVVVWTPGALELPWTAQHLIQAQAGRGQPLGAIVALGCVIRGATSHYEVVCNNAASGLMQVSLQTRVPLGMGLLTTETIEQATERAGTKAGNKGADAALVALELAALAQALQ
jgi:6,7-dimethyl-8-ribityllumazine synthase